MNKNRLTLLVVFVSMLLVVPAVFANLPNNCAQAGTGGVGPAGAWDYIASGLPYNNGCWGLSNGGAMIAFNTSTDSCNFYRSWYEWKLTGTEYLWQTFVVGSTDTVQHFNLRYTLDFIDPYSDFDDTWRSDVYDLTTGAWLGGDFTRGSYGNQSCSAHTVYCSSGSSLAGHTIQVKFTATRNHSDTSMKVNVKYISLLAAN